MKGPDSDGAARPLHAYVAHFRVRHHQLDPLGHVNNAAYLNFLEQAAIDHAAAAGYDVARLRAAGGLFIARRHEIDFVRPAFAGDRLRVATWPVEIRGARAVRAYEVRRLEPGDDPRATPSDALIDPAAVTAMGGEVIVRARTEWAFVEERTGRPRRIPPEVRAAFLQNGNGA
ncbi:MAG: acyl-CoA thioesterase [Chloroflexota bacterium]|nr:acyl-CoA thioesterase [Chloroflexota bacterium]